jgi:hypothetical protein
MKYKWKAFSVPGMAGLVDEKGTVVGVIQRKESFCMAFMAFIMGPISFENIQGNFSLLGCYPSLRSAGKAVESEIRLFIRFKRFPNLLNT